MVNADDTPPWRVDAMCAQMSPGAWALSFRVARHDAESGPDACASSGELLAGLTPVAGGSRFIAYVRAAQSVTSELRMECPGML